MAFSSFLSYHRGDSPVMSISFDTNTPRRRHHNRSECALFYLSAHVHYKPFSFLFREQYTPDRYFWQLIDLLATDKSRYFAQPRSLIVHYFFFISSRSNNNFFFINQRTRRYLELIPKQLRDLRMQLWIIPELRESFTSRSAEVINTAVDSDARNNGAEFDSVSCNIFPVSKTICYYV